MRDVKLPLRKQFPLFTNDSVDKFALGSLCQHKKRTICQAFEVELDAYANFFNLAYEKLDRNGVKNDHSTVQSNC